MPYSTNYNEWRRTGFPAPCSVVSVDAASGDVVPTVLQAPGAGKTIVLLGCISKGVAVLRKTDANGDVLTHVNGAATGGGAFPGSIEVGENTAVFIDGSLGVFDDTTVFYYIWDKSYPTR